MVFKLIRVDVEEPSKIQLPVGNHIIGRGKFLHNDGNDKRVSRDHAELEVTNDRVTLKALHQNPCFYIKANTVPTEILEQNNIVFLSNGDKFGLTPDNFWYEVIHCSEPNIPCTNESYIEENTIEKSDNEVESRKPNNVTSDSNTEDEVINFQLSENPENSNRLASPSVLNQEETSEINRGITQVCNPAPCTPNKRAHDSHDSSPVDVKKVKMEPVTPDEQAQPGPSNDQAADTDSKDQKPNIAAPVSPSQPPAPRRERCMYGANCYRRNPQHKAQFSHPSDSDWGRGDRGVCPYGLACRKRDPRHWQTNEHPPGVNPPEPNAMRPGPKRNRNRTAGSYDNEDSSRVNQRSSESDEGGEDSPRTDLIVTGKRVRKTVRRDTWIDTQSDEDEDPYKTDESDEWQPSSDVTSSEGFSQKF